MKVLFVASECANLVKTGGLADVVAALPKALEQIGVSVRVLLPGYRDVIAALDNAKTVRNIGSKSGDGFRLLESHAGGLDLLVLDAPHLYDRPGNPYLGPDRLDWPDNHLRYGALCQIAARVALEGAGTWQPDCVHAHDWQAGLVPAYLKFAGKPAPPSVITLHNIIFQGLFPARSMAELDLPKSAFTSEGIEYYGKISFLKAGLVYSDRITTVSPTYARELFSAEFGMGLEGVIASRRVDLTGVLNGVDLEDWNPETDTNIVAPYSARSLKRKSINRAALAERFGIEAQNSAPLFCVVSRLTEQKGLDLLLNAIPRLTARGAQLAVLGSGDSDLESGYRAAAAASGGAVGAIIGYDEPLSHLMMAGADAILVPSRFEPCGLTQLYGLRFGTVPVVTRTGGLADTVIDANEAALRADCATGFQFAPDSLDALCSVIDRVCDSYADPALWAKLQRRAMKHPVGWQQSAKTYAEIYQSMLSGQR